MTFSSARGHLGIVMLVLVFGVSLVVATRNTLSIVRPRGIVLRLSHWQLESGFRRGLQAVIDDYQTLHPGVTVEQIPLPDRVYSQSLNTQLISGTAPDLSETGLEYALTSSDENAVRYYLPLSTQAVRPNPYNAGTALEGMPWKDTLLDGMRSGFREGLADYYGVPASRLSMRLYYNKTLLRAATGSDAPPATFGAWMAACDRVRQYAAGHDARILPVVVCGTIDYLQARYDVPYTTSFEDEVDADLSGVVSPLETYIAFVQGKVSLHTPAVRALYENTRRVGSQMQQGFTAMDRQQAQFRFVNGQAAFMWTGSWDAGSTQVQAQIAGFDVGIMRPPLPGKDEPDYRFYGGRSGETVEGGVLFSVNRASAHADVAVDFLMYLTSRAGNEKFNRLAQWPPITTGAEPSELMRPFDADRRGLNARLQFGFGVRAAQALNTEAGSFFQGDITYEQFADRIEGVLRDPNRGGDWAWRTDYEDRTRDVRAKERLLAQRQLLGLLDPATSEPDRYRRALLQQVLRNDALDYPYLYRLYLGRPMPQD